MLYHAPRLIGTYAVLFGYFLKVS
ncbi:hypothetical protein EMIT0196MI5_170051 [Pseudomonas sp. IT-196MI5]